MDAFLTGVGRARVDQFGPPGVNADDSNSGLSLPEFTEAISTGLRGHLAGKGAEDAAKKLFDEMTSGDGDNAVGLTEIKEWLADQPPLDDNAMTGASSASNSGSVDDDDVTGDQWRVSVQRVLLQFVESRDRVTSAMTKTFEDIQGHVLPMMPMLRHEPRPGLRLLSLEGGGIKGLTLIWQLRALERAAGKPIHELFDLIGGVSTGGIIALAIARGTPLDDLEEMYWDIARLVFGKQSAVRQLIKGHAGENDEIKRLLVEGLGDLPMITDDPGPAREVLRGVHAADGQAGGSLNSFLQKPKQRPRPERAVGAVGGWHGHLLRAHRLPAVHPNRRHHRRYVHVHRRRVEWVQQPVVLGAERGPGLGGTRTAHRRVTVVGMRRGERVDGR